MAARKPKPSQDKASSKKEDGNVLTIRLQRYLAQCGLGSRRECEELITTGRVSINGKSVTELGTTMSPANDAVELDGEKLKLERKRYYVLNKPPGFLCTAHDPHGRRVVLDLFPPDGPRLFTVGRLDENTTGLLIVTNDGDLAQKLAHPSYRVFRVYKAQVAGHPPREVFDELKKGMYFTEGKFRVQNIKPIKKQGQSTWVEITMCEGQNREIRRLFARAGHKVMKLERISFGPVKMGRISIGEYRELRKTELEALHGILNQSQKPSGKNKDASSESDTAETKSSSTKKKPTKKKVTGKRKSNTDHRSAAKQAPRRGADRNSAPAKKSSRKPKRRR